jgi:hypothetical protein
MESTTKKDTLQFGQRHLKIDQGLSRRRKCKQVRRHVRRPNSNLGHTTDLPPSPNHANPDFLIDNTSTTEANVPINTDEESSDDDDVADEEDGDLDSGAQVDDNDQYIDMMFPCDGRGDTHQEESPSSRDMMEDTEEESPSSCDMTQDTEEGSPSPTLHSHDAPGDDTEEGSPGPILRRSNRR